MNPMRHPFVRLAVALAIGIALLSTAPSAARQASPGRPPTPTNVTAITAAEFFAPAKVWTVSLTMSAEAWAAMQPRQGASGGRSRVGGSPFLGPPGGRNGTAARQGIEFDYVPATLQINGWTFHDVAVRYKGNNSYFRARRSGTDEISRMRARYDAACTNDVERLSGRPAQTLREVVDVGLDPART